MTEHVYRATVRWTGDLGTGTSAYRAYGRDHVIEVPGKPPIPGSSSVGAMRDPARYNPDELLVAALSACHMLWYLHLCSESKIVVTGYSDAAEGLLELGPDGGGHFTSAVLRPEVRIRSGDPELARALHAEAHRKCFVANSVNFPVRVEPTFAAEGN